MRTPRGAGPVAGSRCACVGSLPDLARKSTLWRVTRRVPCANAPRCRAGCRVKMRLCRQPAGLGPEIRALASHKARPLRERPAVPGRSPGQDAPVSAACRTWPGNPRSGESQGASTARTPRWSPGRGSFVQWACFGAAGVCRASSVTGCCRSQIRFYAHLVAPNPHFGAHWCDFRHSAPCTADRAGAVVNSRRTD